MDLIVEPPDFEHKQYPLHRTLLLGKSNKTSILVHFQEKVCVNVVSLFIYNNNRDNVLSYLICRSTRFSYFWRRCNSHSASIDRARLNFQYLLNCCQVSNMMVCISCIHGISSRYHSSDSHLLPHNLHLLQ